MINAEERVSLLVEDERGFTTINRIINKGYSFLFNIRKEHPMVEVDKRYAEGIKNKDGVSSHDLALIRRIESEIPSGFEIPREYEEVLRMLFIGNSIGVPLVELRWMRKVLKNIGMT